MGIKVSVIIICLIMGILGKRMTHRWLNPMSVLCWMWSGIFFLSALELYNINKAQDNSYLLMFFGVVAYSIGFALIYIVFRNRRLIIRGWRTGNKVTRYEWKINYTILYTLGTIAILYFMVSFLKVANIYLSGNGLAQIRLMAQTRTEVAGGIVSKLMNAFRVLIIIPYSLAIIPVTAAEFWFGKKDKKLLVICITTIGLRILSEGGRINLLYLLMDLLISFSYTAGNKKSRLNKAAAKLFKRNKRKMKMFSIAVVLVLIIASFSRAGDNLKRFTYYYFAMEPYMFEKWKDIVDASNVYGYGIASFNGFVFAILYFIKNIFGVNFPTHFNSVYQIILDSDSQWQVITTTSGRANAYVSAFWYFYLDGRIMGIIIMGAIYGVLMAAFFLQVQKNVNVKSIALYCFAFQSVYMTFSGFSFASIYYCIAFLILMIFSFRKRLGSANE